MPIEYDKLLFTFAICIHMTGRIHGKLIGCAHLWAIDT